MSSIGVQVLHESGCYSDACLQQGDAWFMDETLSHEDAKKVVWHTFKWLNYETSSQHLQITTRCLSLSNHHLFIWIQVLWKRAQLVTGRLWQVDLPDQQVSRTEGEEQTFSVTGVFLDGDEIFRWDQFEMNLRWLFFRLLVIIDEFEMRPSQDDTNVSLPKNSPKSFGWVPGWGTSITRTHRWRTNPAGASW